MCLSAVYNLSPYGLVQAIIQHFECQHRKWCKYPPSSLKHIFVISSGSNSHTHTLSSYCLPLSPSLSEYQKHSFKPTREKCMWGEGKEVWGLSSWAADWDSLGGRVRRADMRLCCLLFAEYVWLTGNGMKAPSYTPIHVQHAHAFINTLTRKLLKTLKTQKTLSVKLKQQRSHYLVISKLNSKLRCFTCHLCQLGHQRLWTDV